MEKISEWISFHYTWHINMHTHTPSFFLPSSTPPDFFSSFDKRETQKESRKERREREREREIFKTKSSHLWNHFISINISVLS